ncbi:EAL domain-containing protein [Rhodovibrionaceae bacterium A322]
MLTLFQDLKGTLPAMIIQLFLFALYSGLSLFIGLGLPELLPVLLPAADLTLSPAVAMVLALFVFLLCALVHMTLFSLGRSAKLSRQLRNLTQSQHSVEDEVLWLRGEIKAVLGALDSAATKKGNGKAKDPSGTNPVVEAAAEVRMLKSLVAGIYDGKSDAPAPRELTLDPVKDRGVAARSKEMEGELLELLSDPGLRRSDAAEKRAVEKKAAEKKSAAKPKRKAPPPSSPKEGKLLEGLSKRKTLDFVQKALRDDMIDLVLQPIVTLPKRQKRYYECFSRLRDATGNYILPQDYIPVAEKAGLVTAIDNMLLFRTIQLVRKIQRKHEELDFFCNTSSHTLKDAEFFGDFVDYLESNRLLVANLIFEFPQADFKDMSSEARLLLRRLSNIGARFSLDQVEDLDLDLPDLEGRAVAFVKVDGPKLVEMRINEGSKKVREFIESFNRSRIQLIVEKLEEDDDLMTLLEAGATLGQGYLFGEPRLARPAN